ncbi:LysR family transcriptional regulator [Roseomonas sp. 18066]|uniref:LysR family transcriptional regulator n=1 Tax=Roseomonas sp. 18066 TaxID=2681412 RepID=UPI00135B8B1C|nr:LysR family transcriptional regulator [Roseomonas sp. 18066]
MPLSFRQLEVIRAVSRHGSVTLAAAQLGISQPAVSMLLRDGAALAGFSLFRRRQGRLQPTPETRLLLGDLDRVFEGVERLNRLVEDLRDSSVGSVQVAATPTLADNLLPPALALLRRARPRLQLVVHTMDNPGVIDAVQRERVDFGLALTPVGEPELRRIELTRGPLIAVVARDHPLAGRGVVSPRDLADFPLISFSRSLPLGNLVEQAFREAGVPRRIALEVTQSSLAAAMARAGIGVAVTDPFLLLDARDHGVARLVLRPAPLVSAMALLPRQSQPGRAALLLLAALRRLARSLPEFPA